jgi:hypothetical protein
MALFVGPDVSIKETSICIVDETGIVLWEGRRASEPSVLASAIRQYAAGSCARRPRDRPYLGMALARPARPWRSDRLRRRAACKAALSDGRDYVQAPSLHSAAPTWSWYCASYGDGDELCACCGAFPIASEALAEDLASRWP